MRVVFLTHNYPRHAGDLAGNFLHPLALALQARGLDIRVVAPSDAGRGGTDAVDGIPVRRVRYASAARERYAYTGTMLRALRSPLGVFALARLRRALRSGARAEAAGAPAVVHAHWWVPAGLSAPPDVPLVLTLHGTDGAILQRSAAARAIARPVFRRAAVVTTVSSHLATAVRRVAPRQLVRIQPMPVNTTGWVWSDGGGGAVLVSRLTSQKRVHLAIAAAELLHRRGEPVPLVVVGDGPQRPSLERLVAERGIGGVVRFAGALPHPAVRQLLATADLAVQCGVGEGFGLAAVEALMSGVPLIVCEDGGGAVEIVRGVGEAAERAEEAGWGWVVPATPEALADAIAALARDGGARTAARNAGRAWRERLHPETVAERFHEWYREAAGV